MFSVNAGQTVLEVARTMADRQVGAILVLDEGRLEGLFSERDLMRRVVAAGRDPGTTPVREVMTTGLVTTSEDATFEDARELMQEHKVRHLPVLRDGRPIGLVSMRDLMDVELADKTEELRHMRSYIHGAA